MQGDSIALNNDASASSSPSALLADVPEERDPVEDEFDREEIVRELNAQPITDTELYEAERSDDVQVRTSAYARAKRDLADIDPTNRDAGPDISSKDWVPSKSDVARIHGSLSEARFAKSIGLTPDEYRDAQKIGAGHSYEKHVVKKQEFPNIHSQTDFTNKIIETMRSPSEVRHLERGRSAYWKDDMVVIRDPSSPDAGTAFRPSHGYAYFKGLK